MKNLNKFALPAFFIISCFHAYAFEIKVECKNVTLDSIYIQSFKEGKWNTIYSEAFDYPLIFQDKKALPSGMYLMTEKEKIVACFFISDTVNQSFIIQIDGEAVHFINSSENNANYAYVSQMTVIENALEAAQRKYMQLKKIFMQDTTVKSALDSAVTALNGLMAEKKTVQEKTISENLGTLLASCVQLSMDMDPPAATDFASQFSYYQYFIYHFFDYFPWSDARALNTPMAYSKLSEAVHLLYNLPANLKIQFLENTLNFIKKHSISYYYFVDFIESAFASQESAMWSEDIATALYQHVLAQQPDLARKLRYENTLKRWSLNAVGTQITDIKIMLANRKKTTLRKISAPQLILILQNPDCLSCKTNMEELDKSSIIQQAIKENKLKILTLYFEKEEAIWKNFLKNEANLNYIHAWDYFNEIESKNLYDTQAIPYMFLLDKEQKVILKDANIGDIETNISRK